MEQHAYQGVRYRGLLLPGKTPRQLASLLAKQPRTLLASLLVLDSEFSSEFGSTVDQLAINPINPNEGLLLRAAAGLCCVLLVF